MTFQPGNQYRLIPGQPMHLHPRWKGDDITYHTAHRRARKAIDLTACTHCGATGANEAALITGRGNKVHTDGRPYSTDTADYMALCRSCHRLYDDMGNKAVLTKRARHD